MTLTKEGAVASACGLVALAAYLVTLAPTVTFVDSGELIVVARELGVAHPPGFPVYTLIAHAAAWLPFGNVAERVHVVSAAGAAVAVGAVVLLVVAVSETATARRPGRSMSRAGRTGRRRPARAGDRAAGDATPGAPRLPLLAAACAGLLLATSRTIWTYATVAEVYTLNVCLVALAFLLVVRWRGRVLLAPDGQTPGHGPLYASAVLTGLALGVHHVTTGLMFPSFGVLIYSAARHRAVGRGVWLRAAASVALGASAYVYLPLAASASPLINWGDPSSLERFWWHVSGWQYQVFVSFSLDTMAQQFAAVFVPYLLREFGPPWLPAALALSAAGLSVLWRRDRTLALALALVVAVNLAYALNYDIDEDMDAYYLPAFLALVVAAGAGAARVLEAGNGRPARAIGLAAVVVAVPVISLGSNARFTDRSRYYLASDYVTNILSTVEPGGLLLTLDWQVYSPWLYLRHVEQVRSDVAVVDVNLLRRTWYFDYLDREYPSVMEPARAEVRAFVEDLAAWERDPDLYTRDPGLNRRINARFYAMIVALADRHLATGPVYVTQDVLTQDRELAGRLSNYQHVPQGLVFQVTRESGFVPPAEPRLETRGLFDGTLAFGDDDVVRMKVAPVYVTMLVNRGRYLALHGRPDRARTLFEQALALDPGNTAARESMAALGGPAR